MVGLKHSPEVHEAPSLLSGDILRLASSSVGLIPIPDCLFLTSLGTRGRHPSLWGGGWFLTLHRPKSYLQDKLPHQPSWISLLGTYSRVAWGNGLSCWLL